MKYDDTLDLLDARVARLIRQCENEPILRLFAHACASYAVSKCELSMDKTFLSALQSALLMALRKQEPNSMATVVGEIGQRVEELDKAAFAAAAARVEGRVSQTEYLHAFSLSRAAFSLLACLEAHPRGAAANAAYAALAATDDVPDVLRLAEIMLGLKRA